MPFKKNPPHYHVWAGMKDRCYNPNNHQYADYGGRGITVSDAWRHDYSAFIRDMGPRPDGYSLDRIDNDKAYGPDNCRWADRRTQQRNQRRAVYVTVDGVKYRAIELAERTGLKTDTIVARAKKGLAFDEVASPEKRVDTTGLSLGGVASGKKKRRQTHCKHGHEFTPQNTYISPEGWRSCRMCRWKQFRV